MPLPSPELTSRLDRPSVQSGSVFRRMANVGAIVAATLGSADMPAHAEDPVSVEDQLQQHLRKAGPRLDDEKAHEMLNTMRPEMIRHHALAAQLEDPEFHINAMIRVDANLAKPYLLQFLKNDDITGWLAVRALANEPFILSMNGDTLSALSDQERLGLLLQQTMTKDRAVAIRMACVRGIHDPENAANNIDTFLRAAGPQPENDENDFMRTCAGIGLARIGDAAVDPTTKMLHEGRTPEHRLFAADALGKIAHFTRHECICDALVTRIISDDSIRVQLACAQKYLALPDEKQIPEHRAQIMAHFTKAMSESTHSPDIIEAMTNCIAKCRKPVPKPPEPQQPLKTAEAREF